MVQISGFVFVPLMRDPLKPHPVPHLRAGWPQISFGLVAYGIVSHIEATKEGVQGVGV